MDTNRGNNDSRMTVSEFVSTPKKTKREQWRRSYMPRSIVNKQDAGNGRHDKKERSIYMLVRLGACALCFCTVLALKLSDTDNSAMVLNSLNTALNDEYGPEGDLGRLRFVQLPSIIDVFAPSDEPIMPVVNASGMRMLEENTVLCLSTANGVAVLASLDCNVKAIGKDEQYGDYVKISCKNDVEICYYGVTGIVVEEGQPVNQNSKLAITADTELYIRVYEAGRPIDLTKYFDIEIS